MKLFLNSETKAYLRELSDAFKVSTNSVRTELNNLTKHKLLISEKKGRHVFYRANTSHPLFPDLNSIIRKKMGIDNLIDSIVERLGNLKLALLVGDYAIGKDSGIIDLVLVGNINRNQLLDLTITTERHTKRKIRTLVLTEEEYENRKTDKEFNPFILLWKDEKRVDALS